MQATETDMNGQPYGLIKLGKVHPIVRHVIDTSDEIQRIADATYGQTWVTENPAEVPMPWHEMQVITQRALNQTDVWLSFFGTSPPVQPIGIETDYLQQGYERLKEFQQCFEGLLPFSQAQHHAYQAAGYFKRAVPGFFNLDNGCMMLFIEPIMLNRLEIWCEGNQLHVQEEPQPNRRAAVRAAVEWGREIKQQLNSDLEVQKFLNDPSL